MYETDAIEKRLYEEVIKKHKVDCLDFCVKAYKNSLTNEVKRRIGHLIDVALNYDYIDEDEMCYVKECFMLLAIEVTLALMPKQPTLADFGIE